MKSIIRKVYSLLSVNMCRLQEKMQTTNNHSGSGKAGRWNYATTPVTSRFLKPISAKADKILGLRNLQPVFDC